MRGISNFSKYIFLIFVLLFLSGCATQNFCSNQRFSYNNLSKDDQGNIRYKGHYKIGKPYQINGKKYIPRQASRYKKIGIASWYGERYGFHGNTTANGDLYNKNMLTAAHNTLQLPCLVKVTNLNNKKSLIVMVNDRGPFSQNRIIDLSERAAELLQFKKHGTAKVKVEYLPRESTKLLNILGLKPKQHSTSKKNLDNTKCTVNCHIKLFNLQHGIVAN
ncbi:MAG: septal ring lytic transglycosylase RlpA family protein [Rickettsiaceae bacterium]|nr:septal ring lytic transglycosylase RlpA family protein [Rickettsiaceae bacterium]